MKVNSFQTLVFVFIPLTILQLSCFSSKSISGNDHKSGVWEEVISADGSLPIARHEAAFVGIDDKMYLLGGRGIKPVSIYSVTKNIWTQGATSPIELHHFQPVVYKKEIYILGAMTGQYPGEVPVEDIYIYNPQKDLWRTDRRIPSDRARGGAGAVLLNKKIFLVCGIKDGHRGDHKKWLDSYDLVTKEWKQLPDAPLERDHFQAAVVNGKIYTLGGRTTISSDNPFKHTIGQVNIYDIKSETWSSAPNELPTKRAGNAVHVMDNEVIIMGGESFTQELAHAELEIYDTKSKTWRQFPALSIGRHGTGLVEYQNALYTASGCGKRGGEPELSDLWKLIY